MQEVQAAWQRMQMLAKINTIEATHADDPGRLRGELIAELGRDGATPVDQGFGNLLARATPAPAELTPEMKAARQHFAAAKAELGIT